MESLPCEGSVSILVDGEPSSKVWESSLVNSQMAQVQAKLLDCPIGDLGLFAVRKGQQGRGMAPGWAELGPAETSAGGNGSQA